MEIFAASFCFGFLISLMEIQGRELTTFFAEHKVGIQQYIMVGHEKGWQSCDILSLSPHKSDAPQFHMDFETFGKLDLSLMLASSHCLLAAFTIESKAGLSAIIQFGWRVIRHKRIALILSMGKGITLDMAQNTVKLPFLIASLLEGGQKQFLCPIVGRNEPLMQDYMCEMSYASYRYKKLKVGIFGPKPYIFSTNNGIDGTDVRLLKLLAQKLKFVPELMIPMSYRHGANLVNNNSNTVQPAC